MPKLNDIYTEYGCNKGELVVIMDGFNIYHDKMEAKYKDSLGGIFPMLCVEDNLDNLHYLKKDFPGAAPTYGLVSPNKEILHSSRSFSDFKAALDALNLKKQPELCDMTPVENESGPADNVTMAVEITMPGMIRITVPHGGKYWITVYSVQGRQLFEIEKSLAESGVYSIVCDKTLFAAGLYLIKVVGEKVQCDQKIAVVP